MKRTAWLFLVVGLAAVACEKTPTGTVEATDEEAIRNLIAQDLDFLVGDGSGLLAEDSSYGGTQSAGAVLAGMPGSPVSPDSALPGRIVFWYRALDPTSIRWHAQVDVQQDTAWVILTRSHAGTFNLWYALPGDTGRPDTLYRLRKPLADTGVRRLRFVRAGDPNRPGRGWVLDAVSPIHAQSIPGPSFQMDSVVVTFYAIADVFDHDTSDGVVDSVRCSGNVLTTLTLDNADSLMILPRNGQSGDIPEVPGHSCAEIHVYYSGAPVYGFLHFNTRWDRHVRRHFRQVAPGELVGEWFTPFYLPGRRNRFHVAFDLIAQATFLDTQAPYESDIWFFPYVVSR